MSERTVEVVGGSLWYRTQGRGPSLILMGGGPSNADTLEPLASRLADDFTVVTYDRRGYSRSHVSDPAGLAPGRHPSCTPTTPAASSPISNQARSRSSAPASAPSSPSSSPRPSPPPSAPSSFTSRRSGSCWPATTASPST